MAGAAVLCLQTISYSNSSSGSNGQISSVFESVSNQALLKTARDHNWSINFPQVDNDTLLVIGLRVEFQEDTTTLSTGNGKFGMRGDPREQKFINEGKYTYDQSPHCSLYFANQLDAVRHYYQKVSRGRLTLDYRIYPGGAGEIGYTVPHTITHYSPGYKRQTESLYEYDERKAYGLVKFIRDAIQAASASPDSPFGSLYKDEDGVIRDTAQNRKAVFLILHAGVSYLTDGIMAQNSPSDMIDAFINENVFRQFKDTLKLDAPGITIQGSDLIIREVMMSSKTSNQDGLNWGIQGILVNQIARQLGIPDLFSTWGGVSAVGAFCVMDFAGYSAGQGFIPPYPSAWVRAFMGWDTPHVARFGDDANRIRALSMALNNPSANDTTILLIPINDQEYFLLENRQRNLSGDDDIFNYDTSRSTNPINSYPFNVNLDSNVDSLSPQSNVIMRVKNNDVSLPASGILVWHVDERVIRERLSYNWINADSSYRGVRLVEADGINDLGVTFRDMFYQSVYDYGGAEDVFPHQRSTVDSVVNSFGPFTRPSTRSNDGGHSFLNISINPYSESPKTEKMLRSGGGDYYVFNFVDSLFEVSVTKDYMSQSWPKKAAPDYFFDPIAVNLNTSNDEKEVVLLGSSGRMYVFGSDTLQHSYGRRTAPVYMVNFKGDTLRSDTDSIVFLDSIPGAFTFSTEINGSVFTPSTEGYIHILHSLTSDTAITSNIDLSRNPSSYITGLEDSSWVIGMSGGKLFFGSGQVVQDSAALPSGSAVNAIAVMKENSGQVAVIQNNGTLSVVNGTDVINSVSVGHGIPPYSLVTGDLNRNGQSEIVVSDSRQGIWVYTSGLQLSEGWNEKPNDWANVYHREASNHDPDRSKFHYNVSSPVLADISGNGYLDIVKGGTNGVYALNYKGVLLIQWPAYLDNRFWYQRGSISSSPVVLMDNNSEPLVLFSSPTGENPTFTPTKINTADRDSGIVTFYKTDGTLDSIWGLSKSEIDTILMNDSLIAPYVLPGGFVDALNSSARRPMNDPATLPGAGPVPQSTWPITTGSPVTTSPLAIRMRHNSTPDLIAVSANGLVYRWSLPNKIMPDSLLWPQTGYDNSRSFAYLGGSPEIITTQSVPVELFSYPNPTHGAREAVFRYQFAGEARNVRLDIFSITGYRKDSFRNLSGSYPDWNEFRVQLRDYGPGVYRCRLEAVINGRTHVKYWKMAVTQ
ncbi:hypothetical protein CHISP_2779 [Chitinispirillum alkaliphilum]|nr:hypothetical protein CHISP_2779 [Chitinispirillum alkaliphilum]